MPAGIPQLEDGFTRIANETLEAIARTSLSDYESRCVHFLWRKTYGWQNPDGESKKVDLISHTQWSKGTGISRRHIPRVLNRLAKRNIITKQLIYQGAKRIILWGFQKRYKEWVSPKQATDKAEVLHKQGTGRVSPKQVIPKYEVSPKEVTSQIQVSPVQDRVSPKQGAKVSPKQGHTKERKDNLQKIFFPGEKEILIFLKELKGWGYKEEDDIAWLREFGSDYPEFSTSEGKACRDYYSGRASPKHKGIWKNRFRNWMIKKREFKKGGERHGGVRENRQRPKFDIEIIKSGEGESES